MRLPHNLGDAMVLAKVVGTVVAAHKEARLEGIKFLLVERIEGEYFTVVGLPLGLLVSLLAQLGCDAISGLAAGGAA